MVFPDMTLSAYNVSSIQLGRAINLDGLRECVPSSGDLIDDSSVGSLEVVSCWRYSHETVTAKTLENCILLLPWPVIRKQGTREAIPDDWDSTDIWYQEWAYDQPRKVEIIPREDNVGQASRLCDDNIPTKGPTTVQDVDKREGK